MKTGDSRVKKVTISLPAQLFVRGEQERAEQQVSRSEFVAALYRQHFDRIEKERRIAQYTAAYAADPATPAEQTLTEASMALLAAESDV
jgi:metal-responsive CopG/Arc/MetJ family transcriptional regulator